MKKTSTLLLLVCCYTPFYSQDTSVFCEQLDALEKLIAREHFKPKPVDDSLSDGVYHLFIKSLDPDKWLFLNEDIAQFEADRYLIDDYIKANNCSFIEKYSTILETRIEENKTVLATLEKEKFDYSGSDTVYFKRSRESSYFKSKASKIHNWNKRVRFSLLSQLIESDSIFENIENEFVNREAAIKPKILQNERCKLEALLHRNGGISQFVAQAFLNAFANYQDPNTFYFNDSDKVSFENSVSNSQLTFGIYTDKDEEGNIAIAYVSPGSAAHINGNFEERDIIKSMRSGNKLLETYCISNEDVMAFLTDNNNMTIHFRIKKKDGGIKEVTLTKSIEKVEENLTRGYVINKSAPMGYINIPGFYTDLESPRGLGVANDVAKELYKLEKENIEGLIIDLRFNGGGSMKEAADLSGMFIDKGPLSIFRYSDGETFTVRDMNRGSLFDKPVVVIVNGFSASASEFFVSVMQDYNRAIIVGAPTYGKSSAQVIFPLSESRQLGYCKVTVDRFYRVTGKSNQSIGIIPDIRFPSIYDGLETSEEFQKFALPNDSIPAILKHEPLNQISIDGIKANSEIRMKENPYFKKIRTLNDILINGYMKKDIEYPLTLSNVYKDINDYNMLWKDFMEHHNARVPAIQAVNTEATLEYLQYNEDKKKTNGLILNEISSDIYIEETYAILLDYIKTKN